jgi:hypothetical protein
VAWKVLFIRSNLSQLSFARVTSAKHSQIISRAGVQYFACERH